MDKTFTCPVCALKVWLIGVLKLSDPLPKSTAFFDSLMNEMKMRGLARPELKFGLDGKPGMVIDTERTALIPIGAEVPGFDYMTDICTECGCVYATYIKRTTIKTAPVPIKKPLVGPFNFPRRN